MTDEQLTEAPRRRLKPVWIVVSLVLLLITACLATVAFQGYCQRQLVHLVEQNGGEIKWLPENIGSLPTPVPFLQRPMAINIRQADGPGFRRFSRALRQVSGHGDLLLVLTFDECTFAGDDFATLPVLPSRLLLAIRHMSVDAATVEQLDRFPMLGTLYLDHSSIDDEILAALPPMPGLAVLSLRNTKVRGPGLASLPQQLPGLTGVHLSDTAVTSEGIAALAGCAKLKGLTLDNTAVDDSAIEYLLQLPLLQYLSVENTQLSEQGLQRLKEKSPDLNIIR